MTDTKTDTITDEEITFTIECLPEDIPIEGNVMASGDDAYDQDCEEAVLRGLEQGNPWAWCCVKVTAEWHGLKGTDYLGGCSYGSEADFREADGYYEDMKSEARNALLKRIEEVQL